MVGGGVVRFERQQLRVQRVCSSQKETPTPKKTNKTERARARGLGEKKKTHFLFFFFSINNNITPTQHYYHHEPVVSNSLNSRNRIFHDFFGAVPSSRCFRFLLRSLQ
jgi:hypothetical protein